VVPVEVAVVVTVATVVDVTSRPLDR